MLTTEQVRALGEITNSSWGSSSDGTYGCKVLFEGNRLKITYSTMAYFASERAMRDQTVRLAEESNDRMAEFLKVIKDRFKESTGTTLKVEQLSDRDSLEMTNGSTINPRRVCVFRRNIILELDA